MKVLHIATSDSGGAGQGLMNLHRSLLDAGIDSRILVAYRSIEDERISKAIVDYNQIKWSKIGLIREVQRFLRKRGYGLTKIEQVQRQIQQIPLSHRHFFTLPISQYNLLNNPLVKEADVINLHWIADFVDFPTFFQKIDKPMVWTLRDENPGLGGFHYSSAKEEYIAYYRDIECNMVKIKSAAIQSCKQLQLVTLAKQMVPFCKEVPFLKQLPICTIYNPIPINSYQIIDRNMARRSLYISEDDFVISFCSCSLLDKRKGLEILIKAISEINIANLKILCIGDDFEKIKNDNRIICMGPIVNDRIMSLLYSCSDVFCSPSLQESFGKTVVEALYCGVPVITFPVGIAPEIITEENGILCEKKDVKSLSNAILKVYARVYNREKIRKKAISLFNPSKIAHEYIQLYNQVLSKY